MHCMWHSITNTLDPYFFTFFILVGVCVLVLNVAVDKLKDAVRDLRRAEGRPANDTSRNWDQLTELVPSKHELRQIGFGWVAPLRTMTIVALAVAMIYPFTSATFCQNVKCKGHDGLMPKTPCVGAPDIKQK